MGLCTSYLHVYAMWLKQEKQNAMESSEKNLYICFTVLCLINILHLFKEAYFCFWADRAVFVLGQDTVQNVYVFLFICI